MVKPVTVIPAEQAQGYIQVPRGFYAVATGLQKDIRYMVTPVGFREAAVVLVQGLDVHSYQKAVVGNLDDFCLDDIRVNSMLLRFGAQPKNVIAFVACSDAQPAKMDMVVSVLKVAGIESMTQIVREPDFHIGVDLRNADIETLSAAAMGIEYKPSSTVAQSYPTHLAERKGMIDPKGYMKQAFDLSKGVPAGYQKHVSSVVRPISEGKGAQAAIFG